jgi:hypothetical protein
MLAEAFRLSLTMQKEHARLAIEKHKCHTPLYTGAYPAVDLEGLQPLLPLLDPWSPSYNLLI